MGEKVVGVRARIAVETAPSLTGKLPHFAVSIGTVVGYS